MKREGTRWKRLSDAEMVRLLSSRLKKVSKDISPEIKEATTTMIAFYRSRSSEVAESRKTFQGDGRLFI